MLLQRYHVTLRALGPIVIRNFPGIPLEGAFTAGLREVSCACRAAEAEVRCPVGRRCSLHLIARPLAEHFEFLPKRFGTPPPPLILRPRFASGVHPQGALLGVEIVLIGEGGFEWVLAGLAAAGRRGIGPSRHRAPDGRFEVAEVEVIGPEGRIPLREMERARSGASAVWRFPSDFPEATREGSWAQGGEVVFRTPTSLPRDRGRPAPRFSKLVSAASRHVSLLEIAHSRDRHFDLETHKRLVAAADDVRLVESDCEWTASTRHSGRQDRSFVISGWVGRARYAGDLRPFLPLLQLVSLLHVTGHAIRGYGEIDLQP